MAAGGAAGVVRVIAPDPAATLAPRRWPVDWQTAYHAARWLSGRIEVQVRDLRDAPCPPGEDPERWPVTKEETILALVEAGVEAVRELAAEARDGGAG